MGREKTFEWKKEGTGKEKKFNCDPLSSLSDLELHFLPSSYSSCFLPSLSIVTFFLISFHGEERGIEGDRKRMGRKKERRQEEWV